jgi:NADPH-dependent curcumin reductase CurA
MTRANPQWRLAARPAGAVTAATWAWREEPVADPADGEFLVENEYLSLDPAMRGWLGEARSYIAPVAVGDVMRAVGAGRVIESRHAQFPVGAHVTGLFGVQRFAISNGRGVQAIDPKLAPLPVWLGALGMPGLTAWFGLTDVGKMKAGDTVVVSGAAGAVGSIAGQVAALSGCRAIGIAGGPAKCAWLRELGYAAAIDYKQPGLNLKHALRDAAPDGIDLYFDNVGGETLDAALAKLARGARVVLCGAISQYNATGAWRGPANYFSLLVNRASMTGFVVLDYAARYAEGVQALAAWYATGQLKTRETVIDGLAQFPRAFDALFAGENVGKLVLRIQ